MVQKQEKKIRAKKLGVLLRDAREAAGKSRKECAEALDLPNATLGAYERGTKSPSLPELEVLALYLDVPLEHFWGQEAISEKPPVTSQLELQQLLENRQGEIASRLEQARAEADHTLKALAREAGMSAKRLSAFESGKQPIPLPELEALMRALNLSLRNFTDKQGPVHDWMSDQEAIQNFLELPEELQAFVSKPINRPFLEVAQRLSQMEVDKLRSVAEGLLEITF
jgi:transcriptional regulator with XRE-family HTH domain